MWRFVPFVGGIVALWAGIVSSWMSIASFDVIAVVTCVGDVGLLAAGDASVLQFRLSLRLSLHWPGRGEVIRSGEGVSPVVSGDSCGLFRCVVGVWKGCVSADILG